MRKLLVAAIVGAGAFAASSAMAGDKKDWEAKVEESFAAMDTDNSGTVSRDEYLAHKAAKAGKHWDKHELGDDGELSLEEAKAHYKAMKEKKKKKKEKRAR